MPTYLVYFCEPACYPNVLLVPALQVFLGSVLVLGITMFAIS